MILRTVSSIGLLSVAVTSGHAAPLNSSYSPAADNGGGAAPGRADIITLTNTSGSITGDYTLVGTSARRFTPNLITVESRNAAGEVLAGYPEVAGRGFVRLGAEQKTTSVTIPDQIQGTTVATLVYDNDRLIETPSTSTLTVKFTDTGAPVYGDLRLANISHSTVTIATGDKARSIYDPVNFAQVTADTGSTLYNVTEGSTIVYDTRTATFDGDAQDGLAQDPTHINGVPVSTYSGVAFGAGDSVTDLASLKRYNSSLIAQLTAGTITPADYERLVQAAVTTSDRMVNVRNNPLPLYRSPPTTSERAFIRLNGSSLTTTASSQLVDVARVVNAAGVDNVDGGNSLIVAENGSTVVNNGIITQGGVTPGGSRPGIQLIGAGTSLTNSATGVIGVGYEVLSRENGALVLSGFAGLGYTTNNSAIDAQDGAIVTNAGIINVANRDLDRGVLSDPSNQGTGKANSGVVVRGGSTASNSGTILIGGADSAVANQLGRFRGAAGIVALDGGTATNAAGGVIRVGTSFAETAADLAGVTDILSINNASGMVSLSGGGSITNNGTIRIGTRAQNATGMLVGGDGNTALNTGTIAIDAVMPTMPTQRNAGISVLGSSILGAVNATNGATGRIEISGVNGVGLLVENEVANGSARAINDGTIVINGGISVDRLRNYGVLVGNAASSARQNGTIVLRGEGAIGVHARNGGTIDVGTSGIVDFQGARQIGYYALGAGSTINIGSTTDVDTYGSTGLRVEGGAVARGGNLTFNVSGAGAFGIVATGASTGATVDTAGTHIVVSGAGATGVVIEGGATGMIGAGSDIRLAGANTTAAIVDGQAHNLDDTAVGAPVASTRLVATADLSSSFMNVTGYVARNQAQLNNSGRIALTGFGGIGIAASSGATVANSGAISLGGGASVGIDVAGAGTTAVHSGSIAGSGTGARIASGGSFTNNGTIAMAFGTGVLVDGAGSIFAGTGTAPVSVADGIAALRLVNGAAVNTAAAFVAGGTAHGVLVDSGASVLTLGVGTVRTTGSGNALENAGGSTAIRLNGTTLRTEGSGAAVHTGVALDAASTATLEAAGANSTGFDFSGANRAVVAGNLTLGTGYTITASGVGATGVRLNTTGTVALGGRVSVTSAQGGSAVVAGPAASVTNSGTLVSSSTAAPVVALSGGTVAFTNTGTITAASATATAIRGGDNGQSVTLAGGPVTGAVTLGAGDDTLVMSGGTLAGAFSAGSGNDNATFRGLTDANMAGITAIAGNGTAAGSDALTFTGTSSTGTRRITGWNTVNLSNASALTSDGDLILAGGTMTIDATSTFLAGNGMRGTVGAAAGGTARLVNAGTIDLTNGGSGATDTLTVRGDFAGQNGTLKLQTVLAGDGSPSDRLIIDGGTVSGTTGIQITNLGGLGAQTTGDGIEIVSAINGGKTTATTSANGFFLAGQHVDAGAFEYRLYASNQARTSESWFLRSVYRSEVPLLTALPQTLRNNDLAMLGTYHRRMGDENGTIADGFTKPGRAWGRIFADQGRFRQNSDAQPTTNGHVSAVQAGLDMFRYGSPQGHHAVGLYGGYTDGNYSVRGFASGVADLYVGKLDPNATYLGLYWTYVGNGGFYVDTVVQRSWYGGKATAVNSNRIGIDGTGVLASVEGGYPLPLSATWVIEPQAQLIADGVSIKDAAIASATVRQFAHGQITGRVGFRARGRFDTGTGPIQPYVRANLWKAFGSLDRTFFDTATVSTLVRTPNSATWGDVGAGLTWSLAPNVAVYGEATHRFTLDKGQGVVGHSTAGSIGVKFSM